MVSGENMNEKKNIKFSIYSYLERRFHIFMERGRGQNLFVTFSMPFSSTQQVILESFHDKIVLHCHDKCHF